MVHHHHHHHHHHHVRGCGNFLYGEDEDDDNDTRPQLEVNYTQDDDDVVVDDDDDNDDDDKMLSLLDRGEIATMTVPTSSSLDPQHRRDIMNTNNYNDGYYYSDNNNNNHYFYPTWDTTTSHIQMGRIVLPIQMNLPLPDNKNVDSVMNKNEATLPPFFFVGKTSRISLVAAYPPPFPATFNPNHMRTTSLVDDDDQDNTELLLQQQRLLQRYSGWYGTTSIHSATTDITNNEPMLQPSPHGSLGYAESTISLNYRCPFFVVIPSLLSPFSFNDVMQDYGMMINVKGERRLHQLYHHQQQQQQQRQHRKRRPSQRRQLLITDLHCTMHLGPSTTSSSSAINNNNHHSIIPSIGTTLSTPNGKSQLRFDAAWSNAWLQWGRTRTKAQRRTADRKHEYYTVCASHDFCHPQEDGPSPSAFSYHCRLFPPLRAQCAMRLLPYQALHSQIFLLTLSTVNKDSLASNNHERGNGSAICRYDTRYRDGRPRPDMTLCLGYGAPPSSFISAGEILLNGANIIDCGTSVSMPNDYYFCSPGKNVKGRDAVVVIPSSYMYSSGNLKLTVDQQLLSSSKSSSSSSTWHGTIEYLHASRVLTFGTMLTRSFATSKFSRLGVGIQQSFFGNVLRQNIIDNNSYGVSVRNPWAGCSTSWLFQLERGGVRLLVPVTFSGGSNVIVSSWKTSLLGLFYASLASIIVDIIVAELLCGVTSRLRISLLRLLLGEEYVGDTAADEAGDMEENSCGRDENGDHDEQWLDEQLYHAKEEALRQVNLMARQARATTKKEEEMGGLVIVNAMYGVMDNKNRRWLSRRRDRLVAREGGSNKPQDYFYAMDATTQLQFWVANSTLRLPKLSKRHLLGFYDVLAYVGDDGWVASEENEGGSELSHGITITPAATSFTRILEKWWKGAPWFFYESKTRRDLTVRLSIRYKFEDKVFDVIFDDDQAVELPSRFAHEVRRP